MTAGQTDAKASTTSGAASPMATTARIRSGSPAIARRSSPLLRPPATSTTRSKARIAVSAAWGVVAFESS